MRFFICTTVYEAKMDYFRNTISSVITQAGDFSVHYHIQDSNRKTLDNLRLYQAFSAELRKNIPPLQCNSIDFSYSFQQDSGMYEGLNNGFAQILPVESKHNDFMLYINADDMLADLALHNISEFVKYSSADFCYGTISHIDSQGRCIHKYGSNLNFLKVINKQNDVSALGFVSQESCAWRVDLWKEVGGFNSKYKLAGDFDLWPRLIQRCELSKCFNCKFEIGKFRKHDAQLSQRRFDDYMREVNLSKS